MTTSASADATASARDELKRLQKSSKSWLTRTKYFQRAIDAAFEQIDVDKSGDVTLEELHAGLLLIHLKMAAYVGAPACKPASKEFVSEIFHLLDKDHSGVLTREEFSSVMKILYSQVFTRIVTQWSLTLMIVPFISQFIIENATAFLYWVASESSKDSDCVSDAIRRSLCWAWASLLYCTPRWMNGMVGAVAASIGRVPCGVWTKMSLTMVTVAQTSVAIPYALGRVEDFFMSAAHRKSNKHKVE